MEEAAVAWPWWRKLGFRFLFCYVILYAFPFPFNLIIDPEEFDNKYSELWRPLVSWVGEHVFHTAPITILPLGSGDTTFNYVQIPIFVAMALAVALAWGLIDRKRPIYPVLSDMLAVYVRYYLGTTMLLYGFSKVYMIQFGTPITPGLVKTYGDMSPMGVLWSFMGASRAYTIFAGWSEVVGGTLLFFRRTSLLGALLLVGVLGNVVMLNFCYDVPVKLYSSHLLLMAIWLAWPHLKRLAGLLVWNRPVEAVDYGKPWLPRWLGWGRWPLKTLAVGAAFFLSLRDCFDIMGKVQEFMAKRTDQVWVPLAEGSPWKRLVLLDKQAILDLNDGSRSRLPFTRSDTSLSLGTDKFALSSDGKRMILKGTWQGKPLDVRLDRQDEQAFPLVNRGFHWINELPYNR